MTTLLANMPSWLVIVNCVVIGTILISLDIDFIRKSSHKGDPGWVFSMLAFCANIILACFLGFNTLFVLLIIFYSLSTIGLYELANRETRIIETPMLGVLGVLMFASFLAGGLGYWGIVVVNYVLT